MCARVAKCCGNATDTSIAAGFVVGLQGGKTGLVVVERPNPSGATPAGVTALKPKRVAGWPQSYRRLRANHGEGGRLVRSWMRIKRTRHRGVDYGSRAERSADANERNRSGSARERTGDADVVAEDGAPDGGDEAGHGDGQRHAALVLRRALRLHAQRRHPAARHRCCRVLLAPSLSLSALLCSKTSRATSHTTPHHTTRKQCSN